MGGLHESSGDGTNLDHGSNIGLDICLGLFAVGLEMNLFLEIVRLERSGNETLVDTAGSAQQGEGDHGQPQTPVEGALRLTEILQLEDVDGFLNASSHVVLEFFSLSKYVKRRKGRRRGEEKRKDDTKLGK